MLGLSLQGSCGESQQARTTDALDDLRVNACSRCTLATNNVYNQLDPAEPEGPRPRLAPRVREEAPAGDPEEPRAADRRKNLAEAPREPLRELVEDRDGADDELRHALLQ